MNEGREEGTSGKKTVWIFCKDLSARLLDSTLVSHPERRSALIREKQFVKNQNFAKFSREVLSTKRQG